MKPTELKTPELKEVWYDKAFDRKVVVRENNIWLIRDRVSVFSFVCEKPHQDEDYSYLCGSEYCRCCQ